MHHNQSTGNAKHLLIMLACCLIPIGLVLAVGAFGITLGSLTPFLPFVFALLCPLLMFWMMRGMGHDHGAAQPPRPPALRQTAPQALNRPETAPSSEHPHSR